MTEILDVELKKINTKMVSSFYLGVNANGLSPRALSPGMEEILKSRKASRLLPASPPFKHHHDLKGIVEA
jgi:hypothetical protein